MKRVLLGVSAVWIALAAWIEFGPSDMDYLQKKGDYRDRTSNCSGTFKQRYDCKSNIMLVGDNAKFMEWFRQFSFVLGPPIFVFTVFWGVNKIRDNRAEAERERQLLEARLRRREADRAPPTRRRSPLDSDDEPGPGRPSSSGRKIDGKLGDDMAR